MLRGRLSTYWLLPAGLALLTARPGAAQSLRDYPYADSLTLALSGQGRWAALDSVGRAALALGTDYPALRQRLGYAALWQGHTAAAIRHYGRAAAANPSDEESRTQLALAYLQLNQPGPARLAARILPDSLRRALHLEPGRAVTQAALEASTKLTSSAERATAGFGRLTLGSQLSTRLALAQGVSYYGQTVQLPERGQLTPYAVRQGEYAALLTAQVLLPVQVKVGYHLIYNTFGAKRRFGSGYFGFYGHLGYVAVRYSRPAWSAQGGFYAGRVNDTTRTQVDLLLTAYPLGNLRLYTFGRGSLVYSNHRTFPNALLGAGAGAARRLGGRLREPRCGAGAV